MSDVRIGLEVHAYVRTNAKLFCGCPSDFLAARAANTHLCPICSGQPGAKPMAPNAAALRACVRLGRALGAGVVPRARFLRKHYFYPDSPSNYQRTSEPVVTGGELEGVRLRDIHVEEDPGAYDPATAMVDYNRAGAPLLEIVTEPDFASPAHARRFLDALRLHLDYLGIGRGEAGIKADCNVSVRGGERAEVKNVNSTRNVVRALEHEVARQLAAHARGERQAQETRHFDEETGRTLAMRVKESESDYRYMPDPDVRPVDVAALAAALPQEEAPFARRDRIAATVGVPPDEVEPLLSERALVDALETAIAAVAQPRAAYQFYLRDVRGELGFRNKSWQEAGLRADDVAALITALHAREVTPAVATRVLREGLDAGRLRAALDAELAHVGPADDAVAQAARAAVAANPKAVADWRAGKQNAVNFLVGATMKQLKGRADANTVRAAVEAALQNE